MKKLIEKIYELFVQFLTLLGAAFMFYLLFNLLKMLN
jgi:uncharacterized membrane protein